MTHARDIEIIERIIRHEDPSFATVAPPRIERLTAALGTSAPGAFLMAAMRLLALPRNGHTRIIPNPAIAVLPLRFVAIGRSVWLTDGAAGGLPAADHRLIAVNDEPVEQVFERAEPFLAGTPARQRAIGAILFAWPEALAALGVPATPNVRYLLETPDGAAVTLDLAAAERVPALDLYPLREHGGLSAGRAPGPLVSVDDPGPAAVRVRLQDFMCEESGRLERELSQAADEVLAAPSRKLVLDLRGNGGGDFLKTVPFLDRLAHEWRGGRCALLIDKFTFSAAIVFAALATHRLPGEVRLIGEAMGDSTEFLAEGGLTPLPDSGAILRHSSSWHDWNRGRRHPTTPEIIARHLVAAGPLLPHLEVGMSAPDLRAGRDPVLAAALGWARS